jgi:hypothetical protein
MINSPSIRQLSRREPSWHKAEVANILVCAEFNVGTGVGAAFFVDVCGGSREVLACGEEACSREEELGAEIANTVVGGESKVGTGGGAAFFVDVCVWACSREESTDVPEGCVRSSVGLSPFVSPNLLRVDSMEDFAFEVCITACAKYDVLVR